MMIFATIIFALCDLGTFFLSPTNWQKTPETFAREHLTNGFRAVSKNQISALGPNKCTWFNIPLLEARVFFEKDFISRVEMSIFNRGDGQTYNKGILSDTERKELLSQIENRLSPNGKIPRAERRKNRSGGTQSVRQWKNTSPEAELVWGVNADNSTDFIRLALTPHKEKKKAGITKSIPGSVAAAKVKQNVATTPQGDVWITNVPMIDQGQKGYCAVAVTERVLRYYGYQVDQHEIAQQAGSTADGGTSVESMIATIKEIAPKYRLGYVPIVSYCQNIDDVKKDLELYNKTAKRLKQRELRYEDFLVGSTFMVKDMRRAMQSEILKEARHKDSRAKKFLTEIRMRTSAGIPIFWGVSLGMFPESGLPQTSGGHMRLIIGYNSQTKEILYTDTWGAGHELKRMDAVQACAITSDAFYLKPL